ncbi:terminase [Clostridia bacterium]|nr:terminase [Clostridia bacterium]
MKKSTIEMFGRIFKTLQPPPDITISEWADRYRIISAGSALPGRWDTNNTPYLREIMDAISDTSVEKVVLMCAAQLGKTMGCILNSIGYYMHLDPCPIMVVQPTVDMAQSFSKEKLAPMLADTPILRGRTTDKKRNSAGTILNKSFVGGHIAMVGANSSAGLRSRAIRVLFADEIDAYPATAGKDGDPLLLAEARLKTFWNSKQVNMSTPTIKGISRIEMEYDNSTREIWNVPCPSCGGLQPLKWSGIIFDRENLSEINYCCSLCGALGSEVAWKEHFTEGKFIAEYPERKDRGFHVNALASLIGDDWSKIVEDFIAAHIEMKKGNIELLKVWTNTVLGQTWEEDGVTIEDDALFQRRERYNCEVPPEVMVLTAGVDTQDDRFEIEVVGWGVEEESWGIKYTRIPGDLKGTEVWNKLDAYLNQTFTKPDGTKLKILATCFDSGGHFTNEVYKFCKEREFRRIYAIRGQGGQKAFISRASKTNREQAYLFTLGVDAGKTQIYDSLKVAKEGANYCHFPREAEKGYDADYFVGLTAEMMVIRYKNGRPTYVWRIKDYAHKRNEPLDCRNYALAALRISSIVLKREDATPLTYAPSGTKKKGRGVRYRGNL